MALYQRRESVGRTRFLLALSLSTLTAAGVAAPLALQAFRADESTFAALGPETDDDGSGGLDDDSLRSIEADTGSMGGIGSRPGTARNASGDDVTGDDEADTPTPTPAPQTEPDPPQTTEAPPETTTTVPDPSTTDPDPSTTDPTGDTTSTTDTTGSSSSSSSSSSTTETTPPTTAPPITNEETTTTPTTESTP